MNTLRLAGLLPHSRLNGPGLRAVLWVQGCTLGCPGCFNPQTHPREGGEVIPVDEALARLLAARTPEHVGVTFSGGEPFQQPAALAALALKLRAAWPEASLMAFSGYPLAALRRRGPAGALLDALDLLVAGPYDPTRPSRAAWRASSNQRLWVLGRAPADLFEAPGDVEIHLSAGGVLLSGFPSPALAEAIQGLGR
ncbi:radical SAM protein [Myxococcota bacterium]|nr:radical SAM protein [Myxococcota bacterium]MBU1432978.1 radical SAM protein [Myxococcota bacterium]MBU1896813.1 radical SAM protein [Myxococcota bacterium]